MEKSYISWRRGQRTERSGALAFDVQIGKDELSFKPRERAREGRGKSKEYGSRIS
jgi:hypothetical protein